MFLWWWYKGGKYHRAGVGFLLLGVVKRGVWVWVVRGREKKERGHKIWDQKTKAGLLVNVVLR
jgi:hypothetical protein